MSLLTFSWKDIFFYLINQKVAGLLPLFAYDTRLGKVNWRTFDLHKSIIMAFFEGTSGYPIPSESTSNAHKLAFLLPPLFCDLEFFSGLRMFCKVMNFCLRVLSPIAMVFFLSGGLVLLWVVSSSSSSRFEVFEVSVWVLSGE